MEPAGTSHRANVPRRRPSKSHSAMNSVAPFFSAMADGPKREIEQRGWAPHKIHLTPNPHCGVATYKPVTGTQAERPVLC